MDKLLSIIIPSYNMEKYLDRCVGSLIVDDAAMLQQLDIIVVNDGSKDHTSEIGHAWERKYPGIVRVIDKANGNYGSCVNEALKDLRGKYVKILDADDSVETSNLVAFLTFLDRVSADLVLTKTVNVIETTGEVHGVDSYGFEPEKVVGINSALERCPYFNMNTIAYRADVFNRFSYCQTEGVSYTDTQWSIVPLVAVDSVIYLPLEVYRYTMAREGQTMEASTIAKNFWMMGECALGCVRIYAGIRQALDAAKRALMDSRVLGFAAMPYYKVYQRSGGLRNNINLDDYDARLLKLSSEIYGLVAEYRSGRVLKFKAAALWRKRTPMSRFALLLFAAVNSQGWIGGRVIQRLMRAIRGARKCKG